VAGIFTLLHAQVEFHWLVVLLVSNAFRIELRIDGQLP
jgi:hypothetical protein